MKTMLTSLVLSALVFAPVAMASDDQGHNGDEASTVSCRVLGADGQVLDIESSTLNMSAGVLVLTQESDLYSARVELSDAIGKMTLIDKRSGDKVTVKEGDFDINEVVSVTLETDEEPEAALTLECVAR